jgi:hypothetical protein
MSWTGSEEKKWAWYKHTKPCHKIINNEECSNTNCNYAHSLDQYVNAILKRKFKVDFNVVNQLTLVDIDLGRMKMDIDDDTSEDDEEDK